MKSLKCFFTAAVLFLSVAGNSQNFDIDLLRSINHNESSFKNDFEKISEEIKMNCQMKYQKDNE